MASSDRLAEVNALILERNEDFEPIEQAAQSAEGEEEKVWASSMLKEILGYDEHESLMPAINKAKVAAKTAGWTIRDHFVKDDEGEIYLTKFAALLVTINANPAKASVAKAQAYFALQVDRQRLEDEKRLRFRLEVQTENTKLRGVARDVGVDDFKKFQGVGISALYGGLNTGQIKRRKRIHEKGTFLDYIGSEELAANLFRITQTTASLKRQESKSEAEACGTHTRVAAGVRRAIVEAGNEPPEKLPRAETKIDKVATAVRKELAEPRRKGANKL